MEPKENTVADSGPIRRRDLSTSKRTRWEPSLGNVYRLTKESGRMLLATKNGDVRTIKLVYLKARDYYRIEREDKAGTGYVDYIFYPYKKDDDAIIIELKVNHTADEAIRQIKDRQYAFCFEGRLGERPEYTGRILAVGIAYNKDDLNKRHECKVEVLRSRYAGNPKITNISALSAN